MAGASSVFGATSKQGKDEFSQHITEADETGEKFVQLFMETMDKRRQVGALSPSVLKNAHYSRVCMRFSYYIDCICIHNLHGTSFKWLIHGDL